MSSWLAFLQPFLNLEVGQAAWSDLLLARRGDCTEVEI